MEETSRNGFQEHIRLSRSLAHIIFSFFAPPLGADSMQPCRWSMVHQRRPMPVLADTSIQPSILDTTDRHMESLRVGYSSRIRMKGRGSGEGCSYPRKLVTVMATPLSFNCLNNIEPPIRKFCARHWGTEWTFHMDWQSHPKLHLLPHEQKYATWSFPIVVFVSLFSRPFNPKLLDHNKFHIRENGLFYGLTSSTFQKFFLLPWHPYIMFAIIILKVTGFLNYGGCVEWETLRIFDLRGSRKLILFGLHETFSVEAIVEEHSSARSW